MSENRTWGLERDSRGNALFSFHLFPVIVLVLSSGINLVSSAHRAAFLVVLIFPTPHLVLAHIMSSSFSQRSIARVFLRFWVVANHHPLYSPYSGSPLPIVDYSPHTWPLSAINCFRGWAPFIHNNNRSSGRTWDINIYCGYQRTPFIPYCAVMFITCFFSLAFVAEHILRVPFPCFTSCLTATDNLCHRWGLKDRNHSP